MKKIHIILLVLVAGTIAFLVTFLQKTTTYDSVDTAMAKPGKYVHLMARWDASEPMEYDAIKNPNHLVFTAVDTLGNKVKVVYNNPKPENFEKSERLVLMGQYEAEKGVFVCKTIQTKCPSKYKEGQEYKEEKTTEPAQSSTKAPQNQPTNALVYTAVAK
jgi:cytochrome c-type biogenesis protein CcmE